MNINQIKEGAYLELYVLGRLNDLEVLHVESAINKFPEVKAELKEIEQAFMHYAHAYAIQPSAYLKDSILTTAAAKNKVKEASTTPSSTVVKEKSIGLLSIVMLLAALGALGAYLMKSQAYNNLEQSNTQEKLLCDSTTTNLKSRIALLENLQNNGNSIFKINATDKYPSTRLYFHSNPVTNKNYIQVQELPLLAANQSFQLWSIKGDTPPIPLNVFDGKLDILEVDFIDGTNAYAITIEPLGGQETPTMDNLIGVFNISG